MDFAGVNDRNNFDYKPKLLNFTRKMSFCLFTINIIYNFALQFRKKIDFGLNQ